MNILIRPSFNSNYMFELSSLYELSKAGRSASIDHCVIGGQTPPSTQSFYDKIVHLGI